MDVWFVDDSCLFIKPEHADKVIRRLDAEVAKMGAHRGEGEGVKSIVRVVCPRGEVDQWRGDQQQAWLTDYIRSACIVMEPNSAAGYFGTTISGPVELTASLQIALAKRTGKGEESRASSAP